MLWFFEIGFIVAGLTIIAIGYWWVLRTPGDGFIADIWKFPPDGG
jgi:hypothetical protein